MLGPIAHPGGSDLVGGCLCWSTDFAGSTASWRPSTLLSGVARNFCGAVRLGPCHSEKGTLGKRRLFTVIWVACPLHVSMIGDSMQMTTMMMVMHIREGWWFLSSSFSIVEGANMYHLFSIECLLCFPDVDSHHSNMTGLLIYTVISDT